MKRVTKPINILMANGFSFLHWISILVERKFYYKSCPSNNNGHLSVKSFNVVVKMKTNTHCMVYERLKMHTIPIEVTSQLDIIISNNILKCFTHPVKPLEESVKNWFHFSDVNFRFYRDTEPIIEQIYNIFMRGTNKNCSG